MGNQGKVMLCLCLMSHSTYLGRQQGKIPQKTFCTWVKNVFNCPKYFFPFVALNQKQSTYIYRCNSAVGIWDQISTRILEGNFILFKHTTDTHIPNRSAFLFKVSIRTGLEKTCPMPLSHGSGTILILQRLIILYLRRLN